jgi:hypothetical protein
MQRLLQSPALFETAVGTIGAELFADVENFEAGTEPADDQTLLVMRWRGPA